MKKLSFFTYIVIVLNVVTSVLVLGIFWAYYQKGHAGAPFSFLQLFTPFALTFHLFFVLYWLRVRLSWALFSVGILVLSILVFGSFYGFRKQKDTETDSLSIMSYNVMNFNRYKWIPVPHAGDSITSFIKQEDPDILCLQEHSRIRFKQLSQYPYRSETPTTVPRTIQAIFSKYPIVGEGSLEPPSTSNNIVYADIALPQDTIRVYNVHLESFSIVPSKTGLGEGMPQKLYGRMNTTFAKQVDQVKLLKAHMSSSPYPMLLCGDFNNTQFSNVFRMAYQGMSDTFLEMGAGLGRTFELFGVPIRIDYIMVDPNFEVLSHHNYDVKLSDHYPIMSELRLQ
ncbi:MAG: endonuclease/exonuclease/phosphatase family protein [Bacteroidota bacterium]